MSRSKKAHEARSNIKAAVIQELAFLMQKFKSRDELLSVVEEGHWDQFASFLKSFNKKECDLQEIISSCTKPQLDKLWDSTQQKCATTYMSLEIVDEDQMEEELKKVIEVLEGVVNLVSATINQQEVYIPVSLYSTSVFLNAVFSALPENKDKLKNKIAHLFETWWQKDLQNRDKLISNTLVYLLRRSLVKRTMADVKRVWLVHEALNQFDMANESSGSLKTLLEQCIFNTAYLKCSEGLRFLAYILSQDVELTKKLHSTIKDHIYTTPRSWLEKYGEIYFKAWLRATGPILEVIETNCLQDLMYLAIHTNKPHCQNLRRILGFIHSQKRLRGVEDMLLKLYDPILWRSHKVANPVVRLNATAISIEIFPLQNIQSTLEEADRLLQKQFDVLQILLVDPVPMVRVAAVTGVCKIIFLYWEIISATMIKSLMSKMFLELVWDASSADVRESVIKGAIVLLDNPLCHAILKPLLSKLQDLVHDSSEKNRIAMMDMLLKVKGIRAIKETSDRQVVYANILKERNTLSKSVKIQSTIIKQQTENMKEIKDENFQLKNDMKTQRRELTVLHEISGNEIKLKNQIEQVKNRNSELLRKTKLVTELRRKSTFHTKKLISMAKENKTLSGVATEALSKLQDNESELIELKSKLVNNKRELENAKKKVHRREKNISKLHEEISRVKDRFETDKKSTALYYEGIVDTLQNKHHLSVENLNQELECLKALETKKEGKYKAEVRLMYYDLLTKGVSANTVQDVVKSVLEHTTNYDLEKVQLPSRTTAQRMVSEAGSLVDIRTAYEMAKQTGSFGHQSDGTTKHLIHWGAHAIKMTPNNDPRNPQFFTLTVSPVISGKADDTVAQLQEQFTDLNTLSKELNLDSNEQTFSVARIHSRMSDRAANEKRVTRLLREEKQEILQKMDNWNEMTVAEKNEQSSIHSFTCAAHKINNMAIAMTSASAKFLYGVTQNLRGMRGAKKHIYECNKLLCEHGRKEYGLGNQFKAYSLCSDEDTGSDLFKPIVGNRYLIFMQNSIPTLASKDMVLLFLEDIRDAKENPGLNRLEQSVQQGYLDPDVQAEEAAFALLYYELCAPLLQKAKSVQSPLEMNQYYLAAVTKLDLWSKDPTEVLTGNVTIWEDVVKPNVYRKYIEKLRTFTVDNETVKSVIKGDTWEDVFNDLMEASSFTRGKADILKLKLASKLFWDIVTLEHLLVRLEIDDPPVCRRIMKLLFSNFMPLKHPIERQMERCVFLIQTNNGAAREFFNRAHNYMSIQDTVNYISLLCKCVQQCIRNESLRSGAGEAEGNGEDEDQSQVDVSADELTIHDIKEMTGMIEAMYLIWNSIHGELDKTCNEEMLLELQSRFIVALPEMLKTFNEPQIVSALIMISGKLPRRSVPCVSRSCLSKLRNYEENDETDDYWCYLEAMCNWNKIGDVFEMVDDWIKASMPKPVKNIVASYATTIKGTTRKCVGFVEPQIPRPQLGLKYITSLIQHPRCRAMILFQHRDNMVDLIATLQDVRKCIEDRMTNRMPTEFDNYTDEFLVECFSMNLRLTVLLDDKGDYSAIPKINQAIAWANEIVIPVVESQDQGSVSSSVSNSAESSQSETKNVTQVALGRTLYNSQDYTMMSGSLSRKRSIGKATTFAINLASSVLHNLLRICSDVVLIGVANEDLSVHIYNFCMECLHADSSFKLLPQILTCFYQVTEYIILQHLTDDNNDHHDNLISEFIGKTLVALAIYVNENKEDGIKVLNSVKGAMIEILKSVYKTTVLDEAVIRDFGANVVSAILAELSNISRTLGLEESVDSFTSLPPLSAWLLDILFRKLFVTRNFMAELCRFIDSGAVTDLHNLIGASHLLATIVKCKPKSPGIKECWASIHGEIEKLKRQHPEQLESITEMFSNFSCIEH